jgi:hypothetical protein
MKKKIIYALFLILFVIAAPSCSKTCKNCKKVYYTGTTYDHEDSATQYCGAELVTIEATGSRTIGSYTVKWECN